MVIQIIGLPPVIEDNSTRYLQMLEAVLNSVDELSSVQATRKTSSISFRIAPSTPKYLKAILGAVKDLHYHIGLRIEFSKSMKKTHTIDFQINFEEN